MERIMPKNGVNRLWNASIHVYILYIYIYIYKFIYPCVLYLLDSNESRKSQETQKSDR